jgi:hypothetical protein
VLATLTAHSGATAKLSAPLKVAGCPPLASVHRGRLRVAAGRDGARIKRVTIGGHRVRNGHALRRGHTYRLVVKDASGATWKLKVRR